MKLPTGFKKKKKLIDTSLRRYLPKSGRIPPVIREAMRYSLFSKGKRIRPILTLAACEAAGGQVSSALPAACAIEMVHTFSLIHDDLPAIDNDSLRRGNLTCHKKFGEAVAILTGDALLALAFEVLAGKGKIPDRRRLLIVEELASATGGEGMIGGEAWELVKSKKNLADWEYIHIHKTAALIGVSVRMGAIVAGAKGKKLSALSRYGKKLGFAFQLIDDILDRDGIMIILGKEGTRRFAERLVNEAKKELKIVGGKGKLLNEVADFVLNRRK